MAVSTTVYVKHPDLALTHTIESVENVDIRVVPDAGTDPKHNVYFFWVEAEDFDSLEAALERDNTVADYTMVSEAPDRRVYRIAYDDQATLISPIVTEMDGLVLDSRGHSNGWLIELQVPDHGTLYRLVERAKEEGMTFEIRETDKVEPDETGSEFKLTQPQIEALVSAYENGYYDEPRETSLEELGSVLGISRTAVSGRLKRASSRLIEESLGYDTDERNREHEFDS